MIHPGDRALVNRLRSSLQDVLAEPWAGRTLHGAVLDAGLVDVDRCVHVVTAGPGIRVLLTALLARRVAAGVGTQSELEEFAVEHAAAMERGDGGYAFCMFVAWGRRPEE